MSGLSDDRLKDIVHGVKRVLPGWDFLSGPQPFTWAPDRHLRACLVRQEETKSVIIRQSWSQDRFAIESFLYRCVLPRFCVRTPTLWAVFEIPADKSQWMVLEDMGSSTVRTDCRQDHRFFLTALGHLHGQGFLWLNQEDISFGPLPQFDGTALPYAGKLLPACEWCRLLDKAFTSPIPQIPSWIRPWPKILLTHLAKQPLTLLHGDTSPSNGVLSGDGVALVDFERAWIGPPSLDLGQPLEKTESVQELEDYRHGLMQTTGKAISEEVILEWAELGQGYNCLYWICYAIERILMGKPPDANWRRDVYEPAVGGLYLLRKKHQDWFG